MGSDVVSKMTSVSFGADGSAGPPQPAIPDQENKKGNKTKPMSKKISSSITSCSSKMTEILSWQSKLTENKSGLILGKYLHQ